MRVLKFGGSSVASTERLIKVADIIADKFETNGCLFVVVSAFGGVTDQLIEITDLGSINNPKYVEQLDLLVGRIKRTAKELLSESAFHDIETDLLENHKSLSNVLSGVSLTQEASEKTKDYILSFGERNSAFILSHYLSSRAIPASYLDSRKFIITNDNFGFAAVNFEETNTRLADINITDKQVYVVTGFIGSDSSSGRTTTLGRGGFDYTASIFAAGLNVEHLEIWTDVDGVQTSNPKKVNRAFTISEMSYDEALEMSHFGAKVLYAPTIRPVRSLGIPTVIKNTFNPNHPGTTISNRGSSNSRVITGLSSIEDISLLSLEGTGLQGVAGIASRFFKCLAQGGINIIMITQASSEHSISIAIKEENTASAKLLVEEEFEYEIKRKLVDPIGISTNLSLLAVVGENMKNSPGVAGLLFETLGKNGVNVEAISQGSSELNITFAIKSSQERRALNSIHDAFYLSEYKTLHLYIIGLGLIGLGLIGSTLLEQLRLAANSIKENTGFEIVINAISNSRKMLISEEGLSATDYLETLDSEGDSADIEKFINEMVSYNYSHSIFIDNTASRAVPEYYEKIITNNIAISTPNKIAMFSSMENYIRLKELSSKRKTPFRFETNVAAGLPVISTIENLINSGDTIHRIEAVLSGSVSYIFNNFSPGGTSFSELVKKAQDLGYTEPDPREDLSGADVRRKILILARESKYKIEEAEINISPILNAECLEAGSIEDFYKALTLDDSRFNELLVQAKLEENKLRFIAEFENGKASVSLRHVGQESPFYTLSGSDNMIVFYTERYHNTPLVIRGPGAGADVTAAGVLAEILSIGNET